MLILWFLIFLTMNKMRPRISESEYALVLNSRKAKTERTVLVIGDLHAPFIKEGYLEFCKEMYVKWQCTDTVLVGDCVDNHFSSFHETEADGYGAGQELDLAISQLAGFYKAFPNALVCNGNHDDIIKRKMATGMLSKRWMRPIQEVLEVPNWKFADEWILDGVKYIHGLGMKIRPRVMSEMCSVCQGHYHSESEYVTFVNEKELMFGLQVGSGIERRSYAMSYGKHFRKPQINCGLVTNNGKAGILLHMPM